MKMRGSTARKPAQRGFTLIEIMVVVAIIGLSLTAGMPAFLRVIHREGMGKFEVEFVEACHEARRDAIMNNHTATLVIHPAALEYSVPGVYKSCQIPREISILTMGVNFIELKGADEAVIHFKANGTSDEFTTVLQATDGTEIEIEMDIIAALPVITKLR